MNIPPPTNLYKRHRFPAEIISHCVWLYFRFCLSYRDVKELMAARGIILTYEAVRYWCRKFGQTYANQLRQRRPRPGDKWHLDEVFLTIQGERHYLALNQHSCHQPQSKQTLPPSYTGSGGLPRGSGRWSSGSSLGPGQFPGWSTRGPEGSGRERVGPWWSPVVVPDTRRSAWLPGSNGEIFGAKYHPSSWVSCPARAKCYAKTVILHA
jgi:hypothetical protein